MMKLGVLILVAVLGYSVSDLPPPERPYRILMLMPTSSKSHRNVFIPLVNALAERGHKVDMLSSYNVSHKNPNIREIAHNLPYYPQTKKNMFEKGKVAVVGSLASFQEILPRIARDLYALPHVKQLYNTRKEYDLIVIDHAFNELVYPFAHEMPFITISTSGMDPRQSAVLGNPLSPSYAPSYVGIYDLSNVFGRILNTLSHIYVSVFWRNWAIVPLIQKEIDLIFPELPPLLEIERNQSLNLQNSHFSMEPVYPLLPSQVEVGGMHCKPAHPLPQNLETWINGAGSPGVIYFSLGSVAQGDTMPVHYKNMFIEAFRKVPQRVIWKFETQLEVPENVMIGQWLPQQDILAHHNVRVFISHGGGLSMKEAFYHGIPVLALPIFGDQPKNAANIVAQGVGLSLIWEELTVELILESLKEIIDNPKYKRNLEATSRLFKDQISSPVDRAVFWTEYVIRHKGAPKLRSPAAKLSWVEFLLLDVIAILLVIIISVLLMVRWLIKILYDLIFKGNAKIKKD